METLAYWNLGRLAAQYSDIEYSILTESWPEVHWTKNGNDHLLAQQVIESQNLLRFIAQLDLSTPPETPETETSNIPPLPDYAKLTASQIEQAQTAGQWLDNYIEFASKASPLTPLSFHEAAGLFAGSLIVARRLHLPVSTSDNWIFPNLYMLFVGQSTRPRKTTALKVLRGLIREAGLNYFLRPSRQTPEAFVADSMTKLPHDFDNWKADDQNNYLNERKIAAQRSLLLEEASHLLDSFNRDFTSGLLPLVLDLYDCNFETNSKQTVGRGREVIEDGYLCVFGATTYGAMAKHFNNAVLWHNGLFARFALIGTDTDGSWQFWPENIPYPPQLTNKLKFIAEKLFPLPIAEIVETDMQGEDGEIKTVKRLEISPLESSAAVISKEAWRQWELYSKAVSYDMIPEKASQVESQFYANYGRLGTMLIKIAMILAVFDSECLPVSVEAKHVYRAQIICEKWRANLHSIAQNTGEVTTGDLRARVKAVIAEGGNSWVEGRAIYKNLRLKKSEIIEPLEQLLTNDEIEYQKVGKSEQYRLKK